jgi:NitT/TauT family transport system substrate-binding protein
MITSDLADIVLLPEPFVTTVMMKKNTVRKAIDVTKEWEKAAAGAGSLTMGCIIVSSSFAEKNPEAVQAFLSEYAKSVEFVNTDIDAAATLIAGYKIVPSAEVAKRAIPNSNIVCITGEKMKTAATGFLQVLFDSKPASIGGKMPGDAFYYGI